MHHGLYFYLFIFIFIFTKSTALYFSHGFCEMELKNRTCFLVGGTRTLCTMVLIGLSGTQSELYIYICVVIVIVALTVAEPCTLLELGRQFRSIGLREPVVGEPYTSGARTTVE